MAVATIPVTMTEANQFGPILPSTSTRVCGDGPPSASTVAIAPYTPNVMRPAQTRRAVTRAPLAVAIAALLVIAVLAIPVKQRCGAPGLSCARTLDPQGNIHYSYEVEPLGVYLAEIITGSNIRFYYTSDKDLVRAR
jgi:hypothetical protein